MKLLPKGFEEDESKISHRQQGGYLDPVYVHCPGNEKGQSNEVATSGHCSIFS